ncbi:MAG: ATP-binding protein [Methylovulum sp.]|nr:ATP-binding protein [Methylovulum sp.]
MGRLFWKFFLVFLFAFLTAGVGVGLSVSFWHKLHEAKSETGIDLHAHFVSAAASVLQFGGVAGLKSFLSKQDNNHFPPIYAVNEQNQDLLGRSIAPKVITEARELVQSNRANDAVYLIDSEDQHRYLLFTSRTPHSPPDFTDHPHQGFDAFKTSPSRPPEIGPPGPPPHESLHQEFPRSPILPIIAGTVVSLLCSALLAWYFAKPIRYLRQAFEDLSQGRLHTTAAPKMGTRRDELADLGQHFDRMAGQIRILVNAQQQLLHDVSHELRSPLARMQAAIGLAFQQPEKINSSLQRIERESQRMSDLIGELLTFSRLEVDDANQSDEIVDMDELLDEIVEDARFEASHKQVNIVFSRPEQAMIKGRVELIYRAVENVLRNAVQHTASHSTVSVEAKADQLKHGYIISIADQGPGVGDTELSKIFKPFYRGAHKTKPDSIGLGLAIARRAIEIHNGKIHALNRPEGGLQITIELPYPAKS